MMSTTTMMMMTMIKMMLELSHSRNYYPSSKNYPAPSNVSSYRNFNSNELCPAPDPFNYKRSSSMTTANQGMGEMSQQLPSSDKTTGSSSSGTFSVTHLVNRDGRKGTKRSSNTSGKAAKQSRTGETVKEGKGEKEEGRKGRSQSSRRNKSGNRSNYSAESLISSSGASTQTMAATSSSPCKTANTKVNQNSDKTFSSSSKTTTNWTNDVNHFSGLQLSSLSPSPANLFPTDLSSIDFQMSLFPPDPSLSLQPASAQNTKTTAKQPAACQVINQRPTSTTVVPDWSLNTGILDNGFLPSIPTLTPPNDNMTDPMTGYTFMSPMTHSSHSTGFYPTCAQTSTRIQNQSYSSQQSKTTQVILIN